MTLRVLNAKIIEVEVHASPDEVIPNKTLSLTRTGKVSIRKIGKTKYYGIMKDFVCGYVLVVAKEIFASLVPSDAMENFQHHMDHLKTKGFRAVKRISTDTK